MSIVMDLLLGAWVFILGAVLWGKLDQVERLVRGEEDHDDLSGM
jgi:hypothetical protein